MKPVIFKKRPNKIPTEILLDVYESSILELIKVNHPSYKEKEIPISLRMEEMKKSPPIWIWYPWKQKYVKSLCEKSYMSILTSRNKNVLTSEEQKNYYNLNIGVIGLSIGSVILNGIVRSGGSKNIKIADNDCIELSNLNRMNASLLHCLQNKAVVAAQNSWEINPFLNIEIIEDKIKNEDIEDFISRPKIDCLIDCMDSLPLKILARMICKKKKIPVLMATSNGDGVIIDVERYDDCPDQKIFNGRLGDISPEDFQFYNYEQWMQKAVQLVGYDYLSRRVKDSLPQIGKTIYGVPQLSTTVQLGSSAISYCLRKIASSYPLKSGRYLINLDSVFSD